jgi:hypothetical protein
MVDTRAQCPMVIGLEPLLLAEPVLKRRVHLGIALFRSGIGLAEQTAIV